MSSFGLGHNSQVSSRGEVIPDDVNEKGVRSLGTKHFSHLVTQRGRRIVHYVCEFWVMVHGSWFAVWEQETSDLGPPFLFAHSYNFEGLLPPFFHLERAFWHHCGNLGAPLGTMRGLGITFRTACAKTMACGRFYPPPPLPKMEPLNVLFSLLRRKTMRCDVTAGVLNTRHVVCQFVG